MKKRGSLRRLRPPVAQVKAEKQGKRARFIKAGPGNQEVAVARRVLQRIGHRGVNVQTRAVARTAIGNDYIDGCRFCAEIESTFGKMTSAASNLTSAHPAERLTSSG
jgi:hypothetical protein